jgi:hypothetical protein
VIVMTVLSSDMESGCRESQERNRMLSAASADRYSETE